MKLNCDRPDFAVQTIRQNLESFQQFPTSTWVKLLELPNPFSFNEALLLCPISENEWLAWIPDYGEAVLNVRQFSY